MENRLEAERDGRDVVNYDPELLKRFGNDYRLVAAMDLQQRLLDTRRAGLAGEISILQENLAASAVQLKGLQQVYGARASQINFLDQELKGTRMLAAEGYVPRNRLLELERSNADLSAGQAENLNNIARVRSQTSKSSCASCSASTITGRKLNHCSPTPPRKTPPWPTACVRWIMK